LTREQSYRVRTVRPAEHSQVAALVRQHWGSEVVVSRGLVYHPAELPGFVAEHQGQWWGLVTYHIQGDRCQIVTLNSFHPGAGVGTALIEAVMPVARGAGCQLVWLITTNDNTHALRFYQRRGFVLSALHRGAIRRSRQLKPEIPLTGFGGIPIRDELELQMSL
jgi:GNAT superfamily N-acetyltransferase